MKSITNNILVQLYAFLRQCDSFVLLDTSKPDAGNSKSLLFTEPAKRLSFHHGENVESFLAEVEKYQNEGYYIAGWFGYEFGYLLEPTLAQRLGRPEDQNRLLADLGAFSRCYSFNHETGETDFPLPAKDDRAVEEYSIANLRLTMNEEEYVEALRRVLCYIEAGDTYQVNYTIKLLFDFEGSPELFYNELRRNQSVSYGAYIRWHNHRILSFSPELFFRRNQSSVTVRPMKGTLKRGRTLEEDAAQRKFLRTDIKNQSENVMIVDLLRNDLGRLMHNASNGEVGVESLFDVETYETLLQMTSTITGQTDEDALQNVSLYDFFRAIFPCGSVTGAPKIRTMEIIDELEKGRRGVYTGAIGCLMPDGEAVFNVPIRTVVLDGGKGEMGIGSGIVHDSEPASEWQECLLKGRFLTSPQQRFELLETMIWQQEKGYYLLDDHLRRLRESACFFLFFCDIEAIRQDLLHTAEGFRSESMRVRLLLEKDGSWGIESQPWPSPGSVSLIEAEKQSGEAPRVVLSEKPVDSRETWYYHKTTNRALYTEEFARARERGCADAIFVNEHGLVTESCIANIIARIEDIYVTPPVGDGLLDGVMRRQLLNDGTRVIEERSLSPADLARADALFLCNSVRGVFRVALSSEE